LERANVKMQEVVTQLNEAQRLTENRLKLHDIIAHFEKVIFLLP